MQVALEGAFPADRLRFPAGFNGALIDTLRHLMQPAAHAPSEVPDEQFFVGCSQFTDRVDAQAVEPLAGLGANAVDFPGGQRPDTARDMVGVLTPLIKPITRWYLTPLDNPRSATVAQLRDILCSLGVKDNQIESYENPRSAYAAARKNATESDRIVAFGSFLTVADVLRDLGRTA